MKPISLASLNLHHFENWKERFPKILELITITSPDIIFTQETQRNPQFDTRNQIEILNETLQYSYSLFSQAEIRTKQKGKDLPFPVEHGLGVMSKYPIKEVVVHTLEREVDDKEKRIAVTYTFSINAEDFTVTNIHFANKDNWALSQFKQVLQLVKGVGHIIGDFNIHGYNFEKYTELYGKDYVSSYDYKKYISFPTEQTTFDYALISAPHIIRNVTCRDEEVSDHRMLVVEILKK
jgi:endonuclease/exonuclease/phosphatase family metal-dependent hydrolase